MTFKDLYVRGEASIADLNDHIGKWHDGDSDMSIFDYLGLTEGEYALFVENPSMFEVAMSFRHGEFQKG